VSGADVPQAARAVVHAPDDCDPDAGVRWTVAHAADGSPWWRDRLEQEVMLEPGDLVYVPPRETHVLENTSEQDAAEYVVARDSPHEDAVVVPWAQEGA